MLFSGHNFPNSYPDADGHKERIRNSGLFYEEGRYVVRIRNTKWGGNSVTFPVNPNPALYAGNDKDTAPEEFYLVLYNTTEAEKHLTLAVDRDVISWPADAKVEEISGGDFPPEKAELLAETGRLSLAGREELVLHLRGPARGSRRDRADRRFSAPSE